MQFDAQRTLAAFPAVFGVARSLIGRRGETGIALSSTSPLEQHPALPVDEEIRDEFPVVRVVQDRPWRDGHLDIVSVPALFPVA